MKILLVKLSGLVKAVTKMETGCLRMIKLPYLHFMRLKGVIVKHEKYGTLSLNLVFVSRRKVCPEDFSSTMKLREDTHHCAPYHPVADVTTLCPETWFLESVDQLHRRVYKKNSGHTAQNGHA